MLRHVAQPLHAGGLEADVGVEAAGDGAVDDGLLLLLQQLDQLLLGADVAPDPPVRVVEEADDGGLFGPGRNGDENLPHARASAKSHCPIRTPSDACVKGGT